MLFFQKLKYEFVGFLYFLHIRMYRSFDQDIILKFFSWMKTKRSFVYFANSGWSNSNLNCSFSSTILRRSVDISLLLGWFSTEDLLLLLFGRFFLCFFLYRFFFWPHHYLTQMSITASKIGWRSSSLLQHFFLSTIVCSWIIFMIISLLTLLIIFYQYDKRLLSDWELRSCHAVNNKRGQRELRNRL